MYDFLEGVVAAVQEVVACMRMASVLVLSLFIFDLTLVSFVTSQLSNVMGA